MIAERHRIVAKQGHDGDLILPLILGMEERPLKAVAGVEQDAVGSFGADLVDNRRHTRDTAGARAVGQMTGVGVVGMDDGKRERVVLRAHTEHQRCKHDEYD
jgi:hypothetical protein